MDYIIGKVGSGFLWVLKKIAVYIIGFGYWGCLFGAVIALFLYILGNKKALRYVTVSVLLYFMLESLKLVLM